MLKAIQIIRQEIVASLCVYGGVLWLCDFTALGFIIVGLLACDYLGRRRRGDFD